MPPEDCWRSTLASRAALRSHPPRQPDFRAVSIAWMRPCGARAGTPLAVAAQASPPRPDGRFVLARLRRLGPFLRPRSRQINNLDPKVFTTSVRGGVRSGNIRRRLHDRRMLAEKSGSEKGV